VTGVEALRFIRTFGTSGAALAAFVATLVVLPLLVGQDGMRVDPVLRLRSPSVGHPFGTDQLGRDLLAMCLQGGRVSLLIGLSVAALSLALGTLLGLLSLFSRTTDAMLMRLADGLMAIPAILLAITLVSVFEAGIGNLVIALAVPEIPRVMRIVRSAALALRDSTFVEAARMAGCGRLRVLMVHILPNTVPLLIVQGTYTIANAILVESGLSFIGLGVPAETASWGRIIAEGRLFFQLFPYQVMIPGIMLAMLIYWVNVVGDRLRDSLDLRIGGGAR
jgi:peptide/nickel transport system permease protein